MYSTSASVQVGFRHRRRIPQRHAAVGARSVVIDDGDGDGLADAGFRTRQRHLQPPIGLHRHRAAIDKHLGNILGPIQHRGEQWPATFRAACRHLLEEGASFRPHLLGTPGPILENDGDRNRPVDIDLGLLQAELEGVALIDRHRRAVDQHLGNVL
jgi:hypothetical protein